MTNVVKKDFFEAIPDEQGNRSIMQNDGHSTCDYLNELFDNSIDANANKIDLEVVFGSSAGKVKKITINDNGKGMNQNTIKQAVTIGKKIVKIHNRIGNYGIGLNSALYSLGEHVIIYSKMESGNLIKLVMDNTTERNNFQYVK